MICTKLNYKILKHLKVAENGKVQLLLKREFAEKGPTHQR